LREREGEGKLFGGRDREGGERDSLGEREGGRDERERARESG